MTYKNPTCYTNQRFVTGNPEPCYSQARNNNIKRRNQKQNGNFFRLPNRIFEEKLTATQFMVYSYLVRCSDKSNSCFPSRENIAKNCGIKTLRTVDNAIKELESKGLITKIKRKDYENKCYMSNIYTINEI